MTVSTNSKIVEIACQKVSQNSVEFFVGKLKAKDFIKLTTVSKRIITGFDENGNPLYNAQIQRAPDTGRVSSIKHYLVNDPDACFPSNIIVSVPSVLLHDEVLEHNNFFIIKLDAESIDIQSDTNPLYLQIVDGQHRFKGILEAIKEARGSDDPVNLERLENFELTISFFIDAEIEFQAMLFSIINRTPQKVSPDLVYDLFGMTKQDCPQKTALTITLGLNGLKVTDKNKPGPFYKRIRLLGKKNKNEESPLTQGTFIKSLITLISTSLVQAEKERYQDRIAFLSGGTEKTIFRRFYAENRDDRIYNVLLNFFSAVRETFIDKDNSSLWDMDHKDNIFQKTVGFQALIMILVQLFPVCEKQKNFSVEIFKFYLSPARNIVNDNQNVYKIKYASQDKTELKELISNHIDLTAIYNS